MNWTEVWLNFCDTAGCQYLNKSLRFVCLVELSLQCVFSQEGWINLTDTSQRKKRNQEIQLVGYGKTATT